MNDQQQIKRLLVKTVKSIPFLLLVLIITLIAVKKMLSYKNPKYQSVATIKLDKNTYGFTAANLFKNFDVFSANIDIKAEIELIQSQVIINTALRKMDYKVSYYRIGEIRTSDIYHQTPFLVEYDSLKQELYDIYFDVVIKNRQEYHLTYTDKHGTHRFVGKFGKWIDTDSIKLRLVPNPPIFNKPDKVVLDHFKFKINSTKRLIDLIKSNLKVKEVDEYVPVILIIYQDESPERAANMVNAIARAYIDDYIDRKSYVAKKSMEFLRKRIKEAYKKLQESEIKLETFKKKYNVVNTSQETETGLREISKIRIQLDNLAIQKATLDTLNKYINEKGDNFWDYVPKNSFGDLLYTELIKKLKAYKSEKEDLLLTYTPDDERVKAIDRKMADLIRYIKQSIKSTAEDINIQKKHLDSIYNASTKMFDGLPEREKEFVLLNREFSINQDIYVFLKKKEIEAATQAVARMSFHRIISKGTIPEKPVFPNQTLILFVSGLLSIIGGAILIYLRDYLYSKIKDRSTIEQHSTIPVAALVPKIKNNNHLINKQDVFNNLSNNLLIKKVIPNEGIISITSSVKKEGKTFIANELAKSFARKNIKTCIIDFNLHNPVLGSLYALEKATGIEDFVMERSTIDEIIHKTDNPHLFVIPSGIKNELPSEVIGSAMLEQKIEEIKKQFDLVIIDTPASAITVDAVRLIKLSTATLYLMRANYTRTLYLMNADFLKDEYDIKNIFILLNATTLATNYTGLYIGSRYNYLKTTSNIIKIIKDYKESYL